MIMRVLSITTTLGLSGQSNIPGGYLPDRLVNPRVKSREADNSRWRSNLTETW